jgi:asparagine synthase (glutamine-hydrolysing)
MAMREVGGAKLDLHTFSDIGEQGATSEERWIDIVNEAADAIPHKLRLQPGTWSAENPSVVAAQGEPFGSIAVYAQNRLYALAADAGVRVAMSGQGGDEVFAGYGRHASGLLTSRLAVGSWGRAATFMGAVASSSRLSARSSIAGAFRLLAPDPLLTLANGIRGQHRWIDRGFVKRAGRSQRPSLQSRRHALHSLLVRGIETELPILLRYEDRNAMEHSVEGRLPFVSAPLVELVLSLPERFLISSRGATKHLLREAMRGLVPDAILDRKDKVGFSVPVRSWPRSIPEIATILTSAGSMAPIDAAYVRGLVDRCQSDKEFSFTDSFLVWRLVGLQTWSRAYQINIDV